jgi:hypothetical protein
VNVLILFLLYLQEIFLDPEKIAIRNSNIPHPAPLPTRERGIQGNRFYQMKKEQNDLFGMLTGNVLVALGYFFALT